MNAPKTCPRCQASLPPDAPEGLCPACLMAGGFETDAITVPMSDPPRTASQPMATPALEDLAPLFPQLEILELLGRGGMGAVYKARQKNLNRLVALKILTIDPAGEGGFAERFQREAQALARLNHPNIVTVYEVGESEGLYYFLMEYVDGANLRSLIRGGEMTPEAALALIPAICDALQFAHDEGIVHRDIKPENVLVDKKGRVKIADFGLAKLLGHEGGDHSLTRTGMALGTPRYMAPEQMDQPETVDHRADIYSLGVVFYEMLTGEVPMGRFELPSKKVRIDVKLDEIVLRTLERDVARRYQHASEVKSDLENLSQTSSSAGKAPDPVALEGVPPTLPSTFATIDAPLPAAQIPSRGPEPRLSRGALWGAIWAFFGVVVPILVVVPSWTLARVAPVADGSPVPTQPPLFLLILMGFLLLICAAAPIGTTILGAVSINQIKRSEGRLHGLPLAFANLVFFPMLLLHGAMAVLLGLLIVTILKMAGVTAGVGAMEMVLLAMLPLIADYFIVRSLWRKVAGAR